MFTKSDGVLEVPVDASSLRGPPISCLLFVLTPAGSLLILTGYAKSRLGILSSSGVVVLDDAANASGPASRGSSSSMKNRNVNSPFSTWKRVSPFMPTCCSPLMVRTLW